MADQQLEDNEIRVRKYLRILTEEQKRDQNVHWAWDYFTPITQKRALCNICSSASGGTTVKDVEHQEASIPIIRNEKSTEHITDSPLENIENIENIEKELPAELELCDKEEVPNRKELPVREELPAREELLEVKEFQLLLGQSSDNIHNNMIDASSNASSDITIKKMGRQKALSAFNLEDNMNGLNASNK
ncbi:PREDICTED: uncharacterized protein LOC108692214 [Atta colombica]|uniref:uncharacterized protein LOC108692214 n=1 Tax=Atta colombica TaxID=520822 RepID=UPI00084C4F6F|nr:PREDICTED: uncharacterized protein LOC108692214 [Atta colombica]